MNNIKMLCYKKNHVSECIDTNKKNVQNSVIFVTICIC